MRNIKVEDIKGNEILAKDIVTNRGKVLLNKGIKLKTKFIEKLISEGIDQIFVEDNIENEGSGVNGIYQGGLSEKATNDEVDISKTKEESKNIIKTEAMRFVKLKEISLAHINKIIDLIINDILNSSKNIIPVKDMRVKDISLFEHSINVAIFAAFICKRLEYSQKKLVDTVTGCILHDFGKLEITGEVAKKDIINMRPHEKREFHSYPTKGYSRLVETLNLSPITTNVILMHRENVDGSGFPNGIKGDKIDEAAKICAICDRFDEIANFHGRNKLLNVSDAIEYIRSLSGIYFDKRIVEEFFEYVPIYPKGSVVLLNTGIVGIVLENEDRDRLRPVVRPFYDVKNKTKVALNDIDLMANLSTKIEREVRGGVGTVVNKQQSKINS